MASYPPPTEIVSIFNEFFFEAPNASISMSDVANNYLRKNTSDIATGFITFNNSLAVNGSFYYNGSIIDLTGLGYVSGITAGAATASKALVIDSSSNIAGVNNFSATNLTGTLQTAAQPNITSIGTLNNLTVTGTIGSLVSIATTMTCNGVDVGSNIAPLVGITLGTPAASKVLTLNASSQIAGSLSLTGNLTATNLTGTLQTAAQPNITSLGTLTGITCSGDLTMGTTTISEAEIGVLDGVTPGTATASKAIVVDSNKDISAFRNLTATSTISGLVIVGLTMTCNGVDVGSNIAPLVGITLGTPAASKVLTLNASSQIAGSLSLTGNLTATNITGTLQTAAQPNITSIGTLTSITTSGTLTMGSTVISAAEIGVIDGVTAGTCTASKALVVDSSKNIAGVNVVRMDSDLYMSQTAALRICRDVLTGDLNSTIYSDGIASLCLSSIRGGGQVKVLTNANSTNNCFSINNAASGTNHLTMRADSKTGLYTNTPAYGLDVQSSLNCTSLYLNGTQITASAAELNVLAGITPGAALASKALVLDSSKNITTLNLLTSNYLTANLAINSPNAIASFGAVNIGPIVTAYGISSIKGTVGYSSAFFGSTNSILWMEGSNASVIGAEINISSGPGSTATNGMRIGTSTANQFSLFTNATERLIITSTGNVGIGDNASSIDKVFGILNGTVGSGIVDMRFGNALSTNNCFTMTYAPTSSGSGLNRLQFDPYGSSGALTILAKKYVGIGTTGPVCPLDVAGYDSGLGILAPYQYAGATSGDGGYVASGTTTGVNINAIFRSNVIFDDKIYIRSDRRLKKDIAPLEVEQALRFVNEVDPVFYRKRDQPETSIQEIGYIAQDILKAGFGNLITHTDNDKMHVEQEGDIENIQFNVEYTKVCAVLHAVIRDQQKCIESLTRRLERLEQLSESDNSSIDIDIVQVSPGNKFALKKTKRSNV